MSIDLKLDLSIPLVRLELLRRYRTEEAHGARISGHWLIARAAWVNDAA